jgi:hypothetical protein
MYEPIRAPFHPDIPDLVMVDPPAEHLTEEGVYIPPSVRPHVRIKVDPDYSQIRQLENLYSTHTVRRWMLPSWGWVGVRTYYGHSAADWETFRRRVVGAYEVFEVDEADKFRILWIEDEGKLEGADEAQARVYEFFNATPRNPRERSLADRRILRAFQTWFLEHSDPPDGHYSVIPTVQEVWSGYETLVCLVADKESIDSVLSSPPDALDEHASIKVLERELDIENMREWAPKLVGRYTGSFKVSPEFLPKLDGNLDEDSSWGQQGSPSTWYLKTEKTTDGVLREGINIKPDDDYGRDPVNLGESSDEESGASEDYNGAHRDEL